MKTTSRRRLALPALALAGACALTACGGGGDSVAGAGSSSSGEHGGGHGGGHSSDGATGASAQARAADVAFLTGMQPHHAQAVEMSDIVLAADPPAEVAALAKRIKDAQSPEIEEMSRMLDALGEEADSAGHAGHSAAHGGMMSAQDLAELRAATGTTAARLYLEAMIAHHEGAVEASEAQVADGSYGPAVALAERITLAQQAEIAEMRELLRTL